MESDFEKKLKETKIKGLSSSERNTLWSNISKNLNVDRVVEFNNLKNPYMKTNIKKMRIVISSILIASLLGGSFATVALADNSRPGDILFPIDLASENFQLKFSSNKKRADLHIKFASERLDEVRQLLALATFEGEEDQILAFATTTYNTATSTSAGTTTTDVNESTDDEDATDPESITQTNNAFLIALEYLENSRIVFEADGNEAGVIAVDAFIDELTELANNQVSSIENSKIKIRGNSGNVKIEIEASVDNVKTKFKFEKEGGKNGKGKQEIELENGDSEMKLDLRGDNISFDFDSGKSNKKKNDKKITICHDEDDTISVKSKDLSKHISHGDTLGRCGNDDDDDEYDDDGEDGDHDDEDGDDDDDKNDKKLYICHKDKNTIHVSKNSLWAHLRHGDEKGKCDDEDDDGTATTTPDTIAPLISNILTSATTTSVDITWDTDEDSDSVVWYGEVSPVVVSSTTPSVTSGTLTTSHSLELTSLTASTTYYYLVTSTDDSGNTATSSENSFTTIVEPEPADTTAPVISGVSSTVATTSSNVSFTTDEDATAVVWYGTATPLVIDGSTDNVVLGTLNTSHSADLASLASSTDYYFVIVATDESGNTATSTEGMLKTLTPVVADTTAPEISNLASSASTTSAVVTFNTNEDATSIVWYGEVSPLVVSTTTLSVANTTLMISHSLDIASLTASTTYYYIIEATDESLNSSTSSEETFVTL